jgi:hypothetical protein
MGGLIAKVVKAWAFGGSNKAASITPSTITNLEDLKGIPTFEKPNVANWVIG